MTYTISQVAKKLNVTIYTIRYYDKEGLSCGGQRPSVIIPEEKQVVFPNPTNKQITIGGDKPVNEVVVTDFAGRQVLVSKNQKQINIEGLQDGTYIVYITYDDNTSSNEKIVVKK